MVSVDIPWDLMDEDETGYVWTFLREARDPGLIQPGAIVIAGDDDAAGAAGIVDIVAKTAGQGRGKAGFEPATSASRPCAEGRRRKAR